jgi:hypothetical protein
MKAVMNFMKDVGKLPLPVRIWLAVLGLFNMLIPLFLLRHFEARIMVIATALSAAIGVLLHKAKGMTNILGLMHAPWLVAVYFLLAGIVAEGVSGLYSLWMLAALIMTGISLVLDVRDVIRYFSGDRERLV